MTPDGQAAITLEEPTQRSLYIERDSRLVAAIELISPRNKDRPEARDHYATRFGGFLVGGVHLVLIDVHPQPAGFSFPDAINRRLEFARPSGPAPCAVSYRARDPGYVVGLELTVWDALVIVPLPQAVLPRR